MKVLKRKPGSPALWLLIAITVLPALLLKGQARAENAKPRLISGVSEAEALRLGERMYRQGILPSGEVMEAVVKGDIAVEGTAFSCESCHMRSGLGAIEGRVITPPTTGNILFRPLKTVYKNVVISSMPHRRPAYTDESLGDVLRGGIDPSGRSLNEIMPRYLLKDEDMAILIFYLKSLSAQFSPGATDRTLRFAVVIADDVSPEDRDAMLVPLEDYFAYRNNTARIYGVGKRESRMTENMLGSRDAAHLDLKLSRWVLKGPPQTWRSQLEEYYRAEPVFALLGGLTTGEWKPVHDFCESHRIPGLLPFTDFPVISETDWYTLYFSKGFYQEGEGAARYLNRMADAAEENSVVEIVRDSREALALSKGFQETWLELGRQPVSTVKLDKGEPLTAELLDRVSAGKKRSILIVWDGPEALPALGSLAASPKKPDIVLVSSGYLGKSVWDLNEDLRNFVYITYPFRLPQDEARLKFAIPFMRKIGLKGDAQLIFKRTYAVIQVLAWALMDLKGNYYRDYLLDVISMLADQQVPLYERFSFGPGQRYASKGCYIVQLGKGPKPDLVKKSDWVIH
jgi:ABC-type branched-subunit amino acid transport system substrate-binding protein